MGDIAQDLRDWQDYEPIKVFAPEMLADLERGAAEIERLREDRDRWHRDATRLSAGVAAIANAPKTVGSAVLRSVAYDVALNCMDGDTAEFQIKRRAGIEQAAPETGK